MFSKPKYSAQELESAVNGLDKLEQLRDKALTDIRLIPALKDLRQGDYDRLSMAIKSRHKLILYMQERMMQ